MSVCIEARIDNSVGRDGERYKGKEGLLYRLLYSVLTGYDRIIIKSDELGPLTRKDETTEKE